MFTLRALDVVLLGLLGTRRLGLLRTLALGFVGFVAWSYAQPPVACGCFPPLFRRCDGTLRYRAPVLSDLKNLASQQEIFFSEEGVYSADPEALAFTSSEGVQVTLEASADAWRATAVHRAVPERVCVAAVPGEEGEFVLECPR